MFDLERDVHVEAAGKTWAVGRWTYGMLEAFGAWVRQNCPDPYEHLTPLINKMPPEEAARELREARAIKKQLANPTLECPVVKEMAATLRGSIKLTHLRLLAHHPEATEDDALAVVLAEGGREIERQRAGRRAKGLPEDATEDAPGEPTPPPA